MIQAIHFFKELITTQLQRGLVTKLGYAKHAIINLKVSMFLGGDDNKYNREARYSVTAIEKECWMVPCYRLHTLYNYNSVYNLYIHYYNSVYILSTKGSSRGLGVEAFAL